MAKQVTWCDIAREHRNALLSITPRQRDAIERQRVLDNAACFGGLTMQERIQRVCEAEARRRNAALPGVTAHAFYAGASA